MSSSRLRQVLLLLIKLLLGAGIIALIVWKLPIRDGYFRAGAWHAGRHLEVLPDGGMLEVRTLSGEQQRFSRSSGARLIEGPAGLVVRRAGEPDLEVSGAGFTGELRLQTEQGWESVPVSLVDTERRALSRDSGFQIDLNCVQGMESILGRLELRWSALACALILISLLLGALRWELLVRAQGLQLGFGEASRLTFIGQFFNNVVPGATGGDVVKAWMLALRHGTQRTAAVTTVIVDRVLGLFVLAGLAAVVMLADLENYRELALILWSMLGLVAVGALLFLSRRVRRSLRVDRMLKKLPAADILMELDRSIVVYRGQPGALLRAGVLSLIAQLCFVGGVIVLGFDLGLDATTGLRDPVVLTYVMTLPCILIVSAVPVLPGGWGVGEAAYAYFFSIVGVTDLALPVALSVSARTAQLLFSLVGGLLLLRARKPAASPASE